MKIFCIGLNKTGTSSLHRALLDLGLSSLHWGGPSTRRAVEEALAAGRPMLSDIEDCDAYSDIEPIYRHFDVIDRQYPGSRFILTTRPIDEWLDSRRRHVERNRRRRAEGTYHGSFLDIEPDVWRADFEQHHRAVHDYFAGRDDLLVLRITEGDGWDELCPFLDLPMPEKPFPWRHRDPTAHGDE